MPTIDNKQITAVILAGGQSSRMHYQDKALIKFNKQTLLQTTLSCLNKQVATIMINTNQPNNYQSYAKHYAIICDGDKNFNGPLAGISQAMQHCQTPYLLVLPCDSPYIDSELIKHLKETLALEKADICVAHDTKRLQPTFALLKKTLLPSLKTYLDKGERKIDRWYQQHKMAIATFANNQRYFSNLNTPSDFARHIKATTIKGVPILGFVATVSNTGKTTLIQKIIEKLSQEKKRVAFLKHAHHRFDIDHPGKDSYQCYQAGASQVLISSSQKFALVHRYQEKQWSLPTLIKQLDLKNTDLILVEGFKKTTINKIELQRQDKQTSALFTTDDNIIAIASDQKSLPNCDRVVLDINHIDEIIDFVCAYGNFS